MQKALSIFLCLTLLISLTGCYFTYVNNEQSNVEDFFKAKEGGEKMETAKKLRIKAGEKVFTAEVYNNKAAAEVFDMLPMELDMKELHGNEKYFYFNSEFSSEEKSVKHINKGDIMLYQDNCLVIFYKDFDTTYSYTRLGRITDVDELEEALGSGDIKVIFETE
ncbi:MAG: hypothetical protein IJR47_02400 [Clostridia bacterium]|nr:hypothetical protein [Clostridia bacterium]